MTPMQKAADILRRYADKIDRDGKSNTAIEFAVFTYTDGEEHCIETGSQEECLAAFDLSTADTVSLEATIGSIVIARKEGNGQRSYTTR